MLAADPIKERPGGTQHFGPSGRPLWGADNYRFLDRDRAGGQLAQLPDWAFGRSVNAEAGLQALGGSLRK